MQLAFSSGSPLRLHEIDHHASLPVGFAESPIMALDSSGLIKLIADHHTRCPREHFKNMTDSLTKIHMNSSMATFLREHDIRLENPPTELSERLKEVLSKDIVVHKGAYSFGQPTEHRLESWNENDLTGFEASENWHIDWMVVSSASSYEIFRYSISFVFHLAELLSDKFPEVQFRIIYGCEIDEPRYCDVRFHKIRAHETPWLDVHNLEGFKINQVLVVDINQHQSL